MRKALLRIVSLVMAVFTATALAPLALADSVVLTYQGGSGYVWDYTTSLTVAKIDQYHNYVEGATLTIVDRESGQSIVAWNTASSSVTFERTFDGSTSLNVGEVYILRELVAPAGYSKASDVVFCLDDQGSVVILDGMYVDGTSQVNATATGSTLYLCDTKDSQIVVEYVYETTQGTSDTATGASAVSEGSGRMSPQTGDDAPLVLVAVVGAVSLALIVVLQIVKRRLPKGQASRIENR